jgi:hypothetical protein
MKIQHDHVRGDQFRAIFAADGRAVVLLHHVKERDPASQDHRLI